MTEPKTLTREDIFAADDLPLEEIFVPEWGGRVYVRAMKAGDRDEFESWGTNAAVKRSPDLDRQRRARMVIACIVDADGVRLFSNEDAPRLAEKSAVSLDRVLDAIVKQNRLGARERKALAKN